jgi:hypothetical protein
MNRYLYGSTCAIALSFASLFAVSPAPAALIAFSGNSSDGHAVSGNANFTLGVGTVTVNLTNTTTTTLDAGELFTGLDFSLGGLTPTLSSKTAIQRDVAGNGTYTDTGSPQDLSWSLVSNGGGSFQLNFNPNAKDSIIAPPSGSVYTANSSINGNNGHNPFAAQTATFVLSVPGATVNTPVTVTTFRYGTTLDPATGTTTHSGPPVPEPASLVLMIVGIALATWKRRR